MSQEKLDLTHPSDPAFIAQRFADLHDLIYARGGIRPSNAAVEELTKLLLLAIAADRLPGHPVNAHVNFEGAVNAEALGKPNGLENLKDAFRVAVALPDFAAHGVNGAVQPIWPSDEPLRISRSDIAAEAVRILAALVSESHSSQKRVDILGIAFDAFLHGKYDHSGGLGTYLTPESVARSMAGIALRILMRGSNRQGPVVVGDPCCGTGRFLMAGYEEAQTSALVATPRLIGADQASSSIAMARVNLLALGQSRPEVFLVDDSITDAGLSDLNGTFDIILTNPPFGDAKYDSCAGIQLARNWLSISPNTTKVDPALAFLSRAIDLLSPGGVLGIILPDGLLENDLVLDLLVADGRPGVSLEGVVSLPRQTFAAAGTVAKTSAVFLSRKQSAPDSRIFMGRVDHVGYIKKAGNIVPDPDGDQLPSLIPLLADISSETGSTCLISEEPVVASSPRGEVMNLRAAELDLFAVQSRAELLDGGARQASEFLISVRKQRRTRVDNRVPFVSVLHVDEFGAIDWAQADGYAPSTPGHVARSGQLIVSLLNPSKFRAAVIPEDIEIVQCSAEFGIFDCNVDPYAVLAMLQQPAVRAQLAPLGRGTSSSRRRIRPSDLLSVAVPKLSDEELGKLAIAVREGLLAVREGRARLRGAYGS